MGFLEVADASEPPLWWYDIHPSDIFSYRLPDLCTNWNTCVICGNQMVLPDDIHHRGVNEAISPGWVDDEEHVTIGGRIPLATYTHFVNYHPDYVDVVYVKHSLRTLNPE